MKLRIARHTSNLEKIESFYKSIVGLEKLGFFNNHDNYSGIFLGIKEENWHLEFTSSDEDPNHIVDEDDALVFFVNSDIELNLILQKINSANVTLEIPKNPYWQKNGIMIKDPDGFYIIFSLIQIDLSNDDPLTALSRNNHLLT